jgi:hypothetical protein
MTSKYINDVWEILDFQIIKSTKEITGELMRRSGKVIAWTTTYRILKDYEIDGKAELLKSKGGLFWRKK